MTADQQLMADSFMIRFPLNGKPCYANVYVHSGSSRKYYVHLVNPHLCPGLPASMLFVENGAHLHYEGAEELPEENRLAIIEIINKHR